MALICRKHVISSSKRQHLHPVNAVEWTTTVTNEWIVGKRSTLLLSQKGDWIAESITFLPREKDSKWGTHLRFFSPEHWRYSSCWAYECVVAWRSIKLKLECWQFLYVANVLLYHANGRNAYAPYNPDDVFLAKRSTHLLCNASARNLARFFPLLWEQWKLCILWGRRGDSQSNNKVWA